LLVLPLASAHAVAPQAGVYIEVESTNGGQTQVIKLSMAPDHLRMDTDQGLSMVSIGGDAGKMLMIQHAERQYIEITDEMMQAMAGMMGQMQQDAQEEAASTVPPTFTRTGNTKQVGDWSAYEVIVEHPEQDGDLTMWFSQDVDVDFRMLLEQAADSMSSFFDNPMFQMGGGGGAGGAEMFAEMRAQMAAADIPDGFPVQVISNSGGTESVNTLRAIDQNASFGADTWAAPEGYSKMEMPFIR
jgi:hypothetical protein